MKVFNLAISGGFDSVPDPSDPRDPKHRVLVRDIAVTWFWEQNGQRHYEMLPLFAGTRWDGASRPDFIGWLVPRWGAFSPASLVHDICFGSRPMLADGTRIIRKHADLLFLAIMQLYAKDVFQLWLAHSMYLAVDLFGAHMWNKHDDEWRKK